MNLYQNKIIPLASDHAGYDKKQVIIKYLETVAIRYVDFGCFSNESCDYPDFSHKIGKAVNNGEYEVGISFCGSGQGMNIVANKYPNVRSALCWNAEIASLARKHNNANICSIPGRFVSDEEAVEIVKTFLETEFEGGRHARRVALIPINNQE